MINFRCTKCKTSFRVSDEYEGKKVRCSKCKQVNSILRHEGEIDLDTTNAEKDYFDVFAQLLKWEKQAPPAEVEDVV